MVNTNQTPNDSGMVGASKLGRGAGLVFLAHLVLMPAGSAQVPRLTGPDHPGPFTDLRQWSGPDDLRSDASASAPVRTPRGRPRADLHRPGPDLLYRFVGEHSSSLTGHSVAFAGDVDCDGFSEVIIGAANYLEAPGAAYLISMADVEASDAADGVADRAIDLGVIAGQPRSWKLVGEGQQYVGSSVASGGDVNGDRCPDLLVGARASDSFAGSVYVISDLDLPAADAADGVEDGVVEIRRVADQPDSWELTGEAEKDNAGHTAIFAGDVNGDGLSDLLVGAFTQDGGRGAAYLLSGAALVSADAQDGVADGRIALASVAAQPDSWKFVGENAEDQAGIRLSVANLDSDGRSDLVIVAAQHTAQLHQQGAVYLVAASDLPAMDAADGRTDGLINLREAAGAPRSWKLLGDTEKQYSGASGVTTGDVDGNGLDDLVIANPAWERSSSEVFVVSVSDLPAADAADGARDGVVTLDRTLAQDDSFQLRWGESSTWFSVFANGDIDGDGLDDILVGNADSGPHGCLPDGGARSPGAVFLIPGGSLHAADAADGATDSVIDLDGVAFRDGARKFIGDPTGRLGTAVSAGDLDGDGKDDPILASAWNHTPHRDCGSSAGSGYVFVMSGAHLPAADALDGAPDGQIHLEALGVPTGAAAVTFTQIDDNVIVVSAPDLLEIDGLDSDKLIKTFLARHGDVVDFLIAVTDLPASSPLYDYAGNYQDVSNSVVGTGKRVFDTKVYGDRLKGFIHLSYFDPSGFSRTLNHEIMHAWANFILAAGRPHWGFSSANGSLGGFDMAKLVSLGNGRYTAGSFSPYANDDLPYSPIELYLAGMIPPEEVPDLWVAKDGDWSNERTAAGDRIFTASDIETLSIQQIVEEYGARTPNWMNSQKNFRAATMLIVDDLSSASGKARALSEFLRQYSYAGSDGDDGSYNFWEATGGRATLKTDDLQGGARSQGNRLHSGSSLSAGQFLRANEPGSCLVQYQRDGNLVARLTQGAAYWSSGTGGQSPGFVLMRRDGDLVVYDRLGTAVWASGTAGNAGADFSIQRDCNLVIRSAAGDALWASGAPPAARAARDPEF